jgi:hypothetical protein
MDFMNVLISSIHAVMVSGVQFALRGRLRTPSAPQRGSLASSHAKMLEELA